MHLFDKLENYSSNVAIIGDNQNSYTYKELLHSADILGEKISKRTTVFLVCKNSYEFMISYIALIQNKVVFFLINNSINKEKFKYLINHYKPIYILSPDEKNISDLNLKELFNLNKKYKLLKTNFQKKYNVYSGLALLMTTSGSTGSPKFVRLSHSPCMHQARFYVRVLYVLRSIMFWSA